MDKIAAITGDSVHHGLQFHLDTRAGAAAGHARRSPFEVVIYDLPGRDCAALASQRRDPGDRGRPHRVRDAVHRPDRGAAGATPSTRTSGSSPIIEPDSLPNAVTNQSKPACATATPFYESGVEYALNKLHAISNVYTYVDIAHSAWLGWPSNLTPGRAGVRQGRPGHHRRLRQRRRLHQRHREHHPDHGAVPAEPDRCKSAATRSTR